MSLKGVGCGCKLFNALAAFTAFAAIAAITVAAAAFTRCALAGVAALARLGGAGIGLGCGITDWGISALGAFAALCAPTARPVAAFAAASTCIALGCGRAVCARCCAC